MKLGSPGTPAELSDKLKTLPRGELPNPCSESRESLLLERRPPANGSHLGPGGHSFRMTGSTWL